MKRPKPQAGYEPSDMTPRQIGYSAVALFAGIGISAGIVAALLGLLAHRQREVSPLMTTPQTPPWPRLEIDARADRASVETAAARQLEGYAWVDRAAGTVRIPIDRAMEILVTRGWPEPPKGQGAP